MKKTPWYYNRESEIRTDSKGTLYQPDDPWTSVGTKLENNLTVSQALEKIANWEVDTQPIYRKVGDQFLQIPNHQVLSRSDNNALLHVAKSSYQPVSNKQAFQWFDALIDEGLCTLDSAVVFEEGKKILIRAKLNQEQGSHQFGDQDTHNLFVMIATSHDGSLPITLGTINYRLQCWNQIPSWIKGNRGKVLTFRHTLNVLDKLELAHQYLEDQIRSYQATVDIYGKLRQVEMDEQGFREFCETLYTSEIKKTELQKLDYIRPWDSLQRAYSSSILMPTVPQSAYRAVQAVTEYHSHNYGRSDLSRLKSNLMSGYAANKNQQAVQLACRVAGI